MKRLSTIYTNGKDLQGQSPGQYFIHGLGRPVGVNPHDSTDPDAPLERGKIFTIEGDGGENRNNWVISYEMYSRMYSSRE
jgi:hypothetical protein